MKKNRKKYDDDDDDDDHDGASEQFFRWFNEALTSQFPQKITYGDYNVAKYSFQAGQNTGILSQPLCHVNSGRTWGR